MKTIKYLYLGLVGMLLFGCNDHRDLYVASSPMLAIENDWAPTKIETSNGATVLIYGEDKNQTELVPNAIKHTVPLDHGTYNIITFNGLMYSDNESHLDFIRYRGTNKFETFEAYITEMDKSETFRAAAGEVIVNNPDVLATQSTQTDIEGAKQYQIKYKNGKNGYVTTPNYIEKSIKLSPCNVTHTCKIIVHLINPKSAKIIRGSLKGFAGSVFMASRMPSHTNVTHQFALNSLVIDPTDKTKGTITSPIFNTFGPPLDLSDRKYELVINVLLTSNEELPPMTFDVTDQVEKAIKKLNEARSNNLPITETIALEISGVELPKDISGNIDVGVGDWGDNVIIPVPIQ